MRHVARAVPRPDSSEAVGSSAQSSAWNGTRPAPEATADLRRDLEDHEPAGPGREPALAAELTELAADRDERIRRGLVGKIVEFRPVDADSRSAAADLPAGDA